MFNWPILAYLDRQEQEAVRESKRALINQARVQYGQIQPCSSKASLKECFTQERGLLILWFNDTGGNTRVVVERDPA